MQNVLIFISKLAKMHLFFAHFCVLIKRTTAPASLVVFPGMSEMTAPFNRAKHQVVFQVYIKAKVAL